MQTANIQLNLAVKSASPSGSKSPVLEGLGSSGGSSGFDSWMREAANRPAQIDRPDSNSLPSGGDELPARESSPLSNVQSTKSQASSQDESASTSDAQPTSEADQSSKSDAAPASPSSESDQQSAQSSDGVDSDNSESASQVGQSVESSNETGNDESPEVAAANAVEQDLDEGLPEQVVEVSAGDADPEDAAEGGDNVQVAANSGEDIEAVSVPATGDSLEQAVSSSGDQTVGEAGSEQIDADRAQTGVADLPTGDDPQIVASQSVKGPEETVDLAVDQTKGKAWEVPPPGAQHASEQGIAHGRPFESLRDGASSAQELPESVSPAGSESSASILMTEGEILASEEVNDETVLSQESEETAQTAASGDEMTDTSMLAEELSAGASEPVSTAGSQISEDLANDSTIAIDDTIDSANQSVAAEVAVPAAGADSSRSAEAKSSSPSANGTSTSVNQSTASVSAPLAAQAGNSGAQQSGADPQSNRQAFSEQLAQMGAADRATEKAADGRAQSGGADAQASLPKTGTPSGVPIDSAVKTPLTQAQLTMPNAVPPQALNRMQQAQWGQKLGERSLMMAQHGPRVAFVQLDPPELGALQVRVHLHQGDQVSLNFSAPNAAVKEAIEQHLPRLREMFAEQGLNLSQSDVRDQSAGGRDRDNPEDGGRRGQYADAREEPDLMFSEMSVPVGAVDYYA